MTTIVAVIEIPSMLASAVAEVASVARAPLGELATHRAHALLGAPGPNMWRSSAGNVIPRPSAKPSMTNGSNHRLCLTPMSRLVHRAATFLLHGSSEAPPQAPEAEGFDARGAAPPAAPRPLKSADGAERRLAP
jgi:hypothetical protein